MPADDAVPWIGAAGASLRLSAIHRLRWLLHKCRAGAFVYAASAFMHHSLLLSGLPPLICPETQKSAGSMVLRNQQTDALNFVKLFYEKNPFARKFLVQKGAASDYFARKQKKRGSNHVERLSDGSDIHA